VTGYRFIAYGTSGRTGAKFEVNLHALAQGPKDANHAIDRKAPEIGIADTREIA